MKEHGVIFTGPSIPAILDGRKTQTRRILPIQPHYPPEWVRDVGPWPGNPRCTAFMPIGDAASPGIGDKASTIQDERQQEMPT